MRPFRFPLSRVLRVRAIEHDLALAAWRAAEDAARRARDSVQEVRERIDAAECELLALREHGPLDPSATVIGCQRLDELGRALIQARELERRTHAEALRLRQAWSAARSERLAIEKLFERRREAHQAEERRREELERAELASSRARPTSRTDDPPLSGPAPVLPKDDSSRLSGDA
jgi:flagellar export protein FliJ